MCNQDAPAPEKHCYRIGISTKHEEDEVAVIRNMRTAVKEASNREVKLILVFDEIECISFIATMDEHWKNGFNDFGKPFGQNQNLTFIVSGVNESIL
ncbi:MAG: hypothetical protein Q4G06_00270 [Clostridia bacterium]|nr:hypothetical protein [Clostridia bacterium]